MEPVAPNAFLSEEPIQLLTKRQVKDLPWLISFNTDEGLYPASGKLLIRYFCSVLLREYYFTRNISELLSNLVFRQIIL